VPPSVEYCPVVQADKTVGIDTIASNKEKRMGCFLILLIKSCVKGKYEDVGRSRAEVDRERCKKLFLKKINGSCCE
jgi:hypothetical protein